MSLHLLGPAVHTSSPDCTQAGNQLPTPATRIRHSPATHQAQCMHAQRQTARVLAQNVCASIARALLLSNVIRGTHSWQPHEQGQGLLHAKGLLVHPNCETRASPWAAHRHGLLRATGFRQCARMSVMRCSIPTRALVATRGPTLSSRTTKRVPLAHTLRARPTTCCC